MKMQQQVCERKGQPGDLSSKEISIVYEPARVVLRIVADLSRSTMAT